MASAARGISLSAGERPVAAFGEVGLSGELRYVAHPERRIAEAAKFGLEPVFQPGPRKMLRQTLQEALEAAPQAAAAA